MGNLVASLFSGAVEGVGNVLKEIFQAPLQFLAGKLCSSGCGPTWDLICYIEHFCIAQILKLVMVLALAYLVFQCIGRSICKMVWGLLATYFSLWEYGCMILWTKLKSVKRERRRHLRDIEEEYESSQDESMLGGKSSSISSSVHGEGSSSISSFVESRRYIDGERSAHRRSKERRELLTPRSHRHKLGIHMHSTGKHSKHKSLNSMKRSRLKAKPDRVHRTRKELRAQAVAYTKRPSTQTQDTQAFNWKAQ
ncbi:uncharacterized protein LOC18446542 isoform X2 [Amborella trichopoda]|uniref:uncharacterized protein LOC18446542 isoform X2 n=1 Tax=Amborella trichopoda TaxID=13333 RepID=UPI0009BC90F7|nr:uncharacterized protein LOC18446542 isoform X2 [Amborella trichopoda]|eukprot:XP_020530672.1 uncharacterized protein LOC18446542 isoform X2 [Amborella trichopoda]